MSYVLRMGLVRLTQEDVYRYQLVVLVRKAPEWFHRCSFYFSVEQIDTLQPCRISRSFLLAPLLIPTLLLHQDSMYLKLTRSVYHV